MYTFIVSYKSWGTIIACVSHYSGMDKKVHLNIL